MRLLPRNRWRTLFSVLILALLAVGWMSVRRAPSLARSGIYTLPEVGAEPLAYSPDGRWLLAAAGARNGFLVDTARGKVERRVELPHTRRLCVYAPDGRTFAYAGENVSVAGRVRFLRDDVALRDARDGRILQTLANTSDWVHVRYAPDGKTLGVVHWSPDTGVAVEVFDASTGQSLSRRALPPGGPVMIPAIAPDLEHFLLSDRAGSGVEVFDLKTGRLQSRHATGSRSTGRPLGGPIVSPDGTRMIALREDGTIFVWNLRTGKLEHSFSAGPANSHDGLTFSPDGATLVVRYRGVARPGRPWSLPLGLDRLFPRSNSPAPGFSVVVWDLTSGRLRARVEGPEADVTSMVISPDGRTLATGDRSKHVTLWRLDSAR